MASALKVVGCCGIKVLDALCRLCKMQILLLCDGAARTHAQLRLMRALPHQLSHRMASSLPL